MDTRKILLTGATGYIGGSVLTKLLASPRITQPYSISVLFRGNEKVSAFERLGVQPIIFSGLDDTELIQKVASEHDIVIQTTPGPHTASAKALILGLAQRKKQTGREVHYIRTSGTTNLGDQPISGKYHESRAFSDKENIYSYQKSRENKQAYPQRTTDIVVVETGLQTGVQTHIIMSPTIYGIGSGNYNKLSIQLPALARSALKSGQVEVIGEGKGVWNYVHIADLTSLYDIIVQKCLTAEELPSGEQGIIFSGTGNFSWLEASQGIADALFTLGAIKTDQVKNISLQKAADKWTGGLALPAELRFASNSRTVSEVSRSLGWEPVKTEEDWKRHFLEDAKLILETSTHT